MDSLTLMVAYGMVFAGVFIFMRTLFHQEDARSAKELLGETEKNRKSSNAIVKYARPISSRYVVPIVATLKIDNQRLNIKRKLIAAGMADEFTPDELYSFKLFLIIGAPAFMGFISWFGEFGFSWYYYPIIGFLGFYYPDMMLSEAKKKRQKDVRKAMPFVVDLLALSVEAGLDFVGSIGKVVEKAKPSALVQEFDQVLRDIKIGSTRSSALKEMSIRLDMQEISSFVAILVSSDQMGSPIGKTLRAQSDMIRSKRFMSAEKEGAKASQKLMLPMFLFILPAIICAIFGPFIFMMQNDSGGVF